jgi:hypothetical protein
MTPPAPTGHTTIPPLSPRNSSLSFNPIKPPQRPSLLLPGSPVTHHTSICASWTITFWGRFFQNRRLSPVARLADSILRTGMSSSCNSDTTNSDSELESHRDTGSGRIFVGWSHIDSDVPGLGKSHESLPEDLNLNMLRLTRQHYSLSPPLMDRRFSDSPDPGPLNHGNVLLECLKAGRAGGRRHKYK